MPRLLSWFGSTKDNIFWLTPTLAVGGATMVSNPKRLQKLGVRAVLDLQAESRDRSDALATAGFSYLKTPVIDFGAPGQAQLDDATTWVLERMQEGQPVFIHCRAGLGRSVTLALATLLRIGYDLPTAYKLVRKERPEILVSDSQLEALRRYEKRLRGE
jgi:protein-tyrosine phosphatase